MIWFTSDTHFNQERTLLLSHRPFVSVTEMNNILVSNWNSLVSKDDIVYHLGDFGDYRVRPFLNGKIVLIQGNYERAGSLNFPAYLDYFDEVYEFRHNIIVKADKEYLISMAHEPHLVKGLPIDDTHINLFGHIHKLCMVKPYGLNVGYDCHNFKPISLDTIIQYHNAILYYYDNDVFD